MKLLCHLVGNDEMPLLALTLLGRGKPWEAIVFVTSDGKAHYPTLKSDRHPFTAKHLPFLPSDLDYTDIEDLFDKCPHKLSLVPVSAVTAMMFAENLEQIYALTHLTDPNAPADPLLINQAINNISVTDGASELKLCHHMQTNVMCPVCHSPSTTFLLCAECFAVQCVGCNFQQYTPKGWGSLTNLIKENSCFLCKTQTSTDEAIGTTHYAQIKEADGVKVESLSRADNMELAQIMTNRADRDAKINQGK